MPDEDRQNSVETSFSELKSPTGCKSVDSAEYLFFFFFFEVKSYSGLLNVAMGYLSMNN